MNRKVGTVGLLAVLAGVFLMTTWTVTDAFAQTGDFEPGTIVGTDDGVPRGPDGNNTGPGTCEGDPDTWQIDAWDGEIVRVDPPGAPFDGARGRVMSFILALIQRFYLFAIW